VSGDGVTVEAVRRSSATSLAVTLTLAHTAQPGPRDITVTNSDGRAGTCKAGCLTVAEMNPPRTCRSSPLRSEAIAGTAQFVGLSNGDRVQPTVDPLEGRYTGLPQGYSVWVLVYPHAAGKYYPQTHRPELTPADLLGGNQFRTSVTFGGGDGEPYDVILVFASPDASRFFSNTLEQWARSGDYRGLLANDLPQVVDEKQCVAVTGVRRA
jgi:hypothetical protein